MLAWRLIKLSGEAPFTAVFKYLWTTVRISGLPVRLCGKPVRTTVKHGSSSSQKIDTEYQLVKTFDKGFRAKVVNVNSGAEKYTEAVSVVAYDKPDIAVIGPTTFLSEVKASTQRT